MSKKEQVRKLTQQEFDSMKPELTAYIEGVKALSTLNRMLQLFAPGCDLEADTLMLVRTVEEEPVAEAEIEGADYALEAEIEGADYAIEAD